MDSVLKNIEEERRQKIDEGLTEIRKEEIRKELEAMSSEEINEEIHKLYEIFSTSFEKCIDAEADFFEDLIFVLSEGKFVIDTSEKVDKNVKEKFYILLKKIERAFEFSKKYHEFTVDFGSLEHADLTLLGLELLTSEQIENTFNEKKSLEDESIKESINLLEKANEAYKKYEEIFENAEKIYNEVNAKHEEYKELYLLTIRLHIEENSKSKEHIRQLEEMKEIIKSNVEKIPTREQVKEIIKNSMNK